MKNVDRLSADQLKQSRETWWNIQFSRLLNDKLSIQPRDRVLDAGCGLGTFYQKLISDFSLSFEYFGIDIDADRIKLAKSELADQTNATFLVGDIFKLPFQENYFDKSAVLLTLQHIEEPIKAIRELVRVTKVGGKLLIAEPINTKQNLFCSDPEVNVSPFYQSLCEFINKQKSGDQDIGQKIPKMMADIDLREIDVQVFSASSHGIWSEFRKRIDQMLKLLKSAYAIPAEIVDPLEAELRKIKSDSYCILSAPIIFSTAIKER